jgi:drug/metabolite transporter (DMT)-like permease
VSRRALLLFLSASVIWGSSFLLIRVAVRGISPSALVFGRTVLGAAVLVPVALRTGAFGGLRRKIPAVVTLTMLNMCLPIFLTAWAEQRITSSAAGILIATDPLFTALLALWLIRAEAVNPRQLAGLVLGFAGVVALLGLDFSTQIAALLGAGTVLLSAVGYAASALLYRRWLTGTPALGVSALMMLCSSAVFVLPAAADLPRHMPGRTSIAALVTLGIVNTGLLSWVYFALVRETGAAVTSLVTYVVPVVALVLGVSLLGESLTLGAVLGLILIAVGTWLATGARRPRLGQRPSRVRDRAGRAHHNGSDGRRITG